MTKPQEAQLTSKDAVILPSPFWFLSNFGLDIGRVKSHSLYFCTEGRCNDVHEVDNFWPVWKLKFSTCTIFISMAFVDRFMIFRLRFVEHHKSDRVYCARVQQHQSTAMHVHTRTISHTKSHIHACIHGHTYTLTKTQAPRVCIYIYTHKRINVFFFI